MNAPKKSRASRRRRRPRPKISFFDFDRAWGVVEPLLDEPLAQRALNTGMNSYLSANRRRFKWDPEHGPWRYTSSDYWANRSLRLTEESPEWAAYMEAHGPWDEDGDLTAEEEKEWWRAFDKISARFDPRPRTADWYRCYGACHWLAGWNCAIGQLIMPERHWYVVQAENHSNAIGLGPGDAIFADILWGHDQPLDKVWKAVQGGCCLRLEDEIAFRRSPRRGHRNCVPLRALLARLLNVPGVTAAADPAVAER